MNSAGYSYEAYCIHLSTHLISEETRHQIKVLITSFEPHSKHKQRRHCDALLLLLLLLLRGVIRLSGAWVVGGRGEWVSVECVGNGGEGGERQ